MSRRTEGVRDWGTERVKGRESEFCIGTVCETDCLFALACGPDYYYYYYYYYYYFMKYCHALTRGRPFVATS